MCNIIPYNQIGGISKSAFLLYGTDLHTAMCTSQKILSWSPRTGGPFVKHDLIMHNFNVWFRCCNPTFG